jgi:hypothetical protein
MRKSLLSAAAAVSLAVASLPALASAAPTEVDGSRLAASGLVELVQGCNDPTATPVDRPKFLIDRGPGKPPIGRYSSGWKVEGAEFGAGSAALVSSPTTLTDFRIQLNAPGGAARGTAVARYYPPSDDGYWVGMSLLGADTKKGWHAVNAGNRVFTWSHYTTGTLDRTAPSATIPGHTSVYGGDGDGAELGFVFGCDGNPFYTDRLQIATAEDDLTFDYGGFRTRAELRLGSKKPNKTTITVGKRLDLKGRLFQKYPGGRLAGQLSFQSKPL